VRLLLNCLRPLCGSTLDHLSDNVSEPFGSRSPAISSNLHPTSDNVSDPEVSPRFSCWHTQLIEQLWAWVSELINEFAHAQT
jgi:hypothetical protein